MISEIFLRDSLLWSCVWQSTIFLVVGLVSSFIMRHRSARAHQVLFSAMIAAVIVPIMSILVKHYELGMFVAEPVVIQSPAKDLATASNYGAPGIISAENIEHNPSPIEKNSPPAITGSEIARFPWRLVVLYGWIAASLILAARLLLTFALGVRLLGRALPLDCERIKEAVHLAKDKLGIDKDVMVRSSRGVRSPVIWCWRRRPILLVPSAAGRLDNGVDWAGVLCHELAHWKRRDHISGLFAELAVCILPWHPLVWWAKFRLVRLSEQACDDWVVATGQPCTDYAESLLDLTPGGQMAFVPAVVTSKKTLAGRVRRILEDNCSNPRTGAVWALAVSIVAICLTFGVAFAQRRPSQPTGTVKTKVGRSAVIEQLASGTMIKGRILDPNNEPAYLARIVALPMTSYGTEIYLNNKEGYFELPWSPTWIDEGQAVCLIARGRYDRNEAAFVEVYDPTSPVIVRLEPAVTLTGKVIDPNGQPISSTVILSLARPFRCRAPIRAGSTAPPGHIDKSRRGKFTIDMLPYNQTYKLNIRAEGYQTKQFTVDATDRSKEVIDIGTITMQPQDPAKPAIAEQSPNPDLMKEFHEIYRLEEGEVIKLIKTPFVLGRQEYLATKGASSFGLHSGAFQMASRWDGELKTRTASTGLARLKEVLRRLLRMPVYDFKLPKELNVRLPHGDWIVREESSLQEQLRALEEIIYSQLHRSIRFEKRTAERDTIVVTGRYAFTPLSDEHADQLQIFGDRGFIPNVHEGEADSLSELFLFIAHRMNIPFKDRTEPTEITKIRYRYDYGLFNPSRTEKYLPMILDAIAKQTGLQFKLERRPAEIWFVTETKGN